MATLDVLGPRARLAVAVLVELAYIGGRTLIRAQVHGEIAVELAVTAWRLVILAFYLWLFIGELRAAWKGRPRWALHPLLVAATALSLVLVLFGGYWQAQTFDTKLVFALTTPVVALREELFYRFILQGGLERLVHPLAAVLGTTVLFTLFHIGAQPMNAHTAIEIASSGVLLGVIYRQTRNLALVVILHLAVDWAYIVSAKGIAPAWTLMGGLVVALVALLGFWAGGARRETRA